MLINYIKSILENALKFSISRKEHPLIGNTFKYFTTHPVAGLNKKRLLGILSRVSRIVESWHYARIMDVASGGGLISSAIAESLRGMYGNSCSVVGVDINSSELELARSFAEHYGYPVSFIRADVVNETSWKNQVEQELSGPPNVVILAYALHHLPNVSQFLDNLYGWLPNDSILIINEENPISPIFRLKHIVRTLIQNDTKEENHHSFEEWRALLVSSGFEVDNPEGLDILCYVPDKYRWSILFNARKT